MRDRDTGQVTRDAAEVYEEFFVPALFASWTSRVVDAAGIEPGWRVLDVACGTGVLARDVAARVGPEGAVVGLDLNEGMLAVAARRAPEIEWRNGRAEALPFDDATFDAVVSQFGLMFFEDRKAALREMVRVLRPGGRLAVAVWDSLDHVPGYAALVALLERTLGDDVASLLRAPFVLGDLDALRALVEESGIPDAAIATEQGVARFPSIRSWIFTDVRGWTLAAAVDDEQFERVAEEAERALRPFVTPDGSVEFPMPAHIVTATARSRPLSA